MILQFEDLVAGASAETPDCQISAAELTRFLALTREQYSIHVDADFARAIGAADRILPGKLVHAVARARLAAVFGAFAEARLLRSTYDFLRPVSPGQVFRARLEVVATEPLDGSHGSVTTLRRILDEQGRVSSIARVTERVARRR